MDTTTPQDGNGTPASEAVAPEEKAPDTAATTAFEARYGELKAAKADARTVQSELSQIANEIVTLQKKARDKDEELKRARSKVNAVKDGLDTLFANEMRNY